MRVWWWAEKTRYWLVSQSKVIRWEELSLSRRKRCPWSVRDPDS